MSSINLLDEDLYIWNEFRNGNADAFGKLIRTHYQDLYNYGTRFTRDEELVKDCIQDLFLALWANRQTISETSFVKYYLLKSLRRRLGEAVGKSRPFSSRYEPHFETFFSEVPAVETSIIREEELIDLTRKMRAILMGLSKRQQEVIYLRYYMDADVEEIAEIMGLNRQSVYNLLHDALKRLRKISQKENFFSKYSRYFSWLPLY